MAHSKNSEKHHSAYTTPGPQGSGLLFHSHLPGRTPYIKQKCPLSLYTSEQGPGSHRTAASPTSHMAARWHKSRSDDEGTRLSRGLSGPPCPFSVASELHPAQPPTAKREKATNLNTRTLHTLEPSTLPTCFPKEEGIIKQTSQPLTTCGFYIYTNALLAMGAQHPGIQEKSSQTKCKQETKSGKTTSFMSVSPKPSSSEPSLGIAGSQVRAQETATAAHQEPSLRYLLRSFSNFAFPRVLRGYGNKLLKLYRKAERQAHFCPRKPSRIILIPITCLPSQ